MNYYFLLEDEKSFYRILPNWLSYLDFGCEQVREISKLCGNHYILESGHGVTQLETKIIFDTIDTLIDNPGKVDKLVIIVDSEDIGVQNRKDKIFNEINTHYSDCNLLFSINIFVCNRCAETWFLGSKGMYPKQDDVYQFFSDYYDFYNVETNDPENMGKPLDYVKSTASYHFQYLHALTHNIGMKFHKSRLKYHKNSPGYISYQEHFDGLVLRISETSDIPSFKEFYDFILEERKYNH